MILCQIFALLLFTARFASAFDCGISGNPSGLIVNGKQSKRGAWPWLVSIYRIQGNRLMCGGSLVSSDTVVTAAHCMQEKRAPHPRLPNEIVIKLGRYNLRQVYERGGIDAFAYEIFVHPQWRFYTPDFDSDIAIIKLTSPVVYNDVIFPVCLWQYEQRPAETRGTIVGYGKSENAKLVHVNTPRELQVTIVTNENCFLKNPRFADISSVNTFCAGQSNNSGACAGDSGGGLYIDHGGVWFLRGIISASLIASDHQCDVSNDAIYTDVPKYRDWIYEKVYYALAHRYTHQPISPVIAINNIIKKKEIVCFIANWSMNRGKGGKFTLDRHFKPELCTMAVYHAANLDDNGRLTSSNPRLDFDDNGGLGGYRKITSLKLTHPHLRVLLNVGGKGAGPEKFSPLAANPLRRRNFAVQSAEFLRTHGFDGLNLFWDYPGDKAHGTPDDKSNFVLLLRDVFDVYRRQGLYLSVTLRAVKWAINVAYDLYAISNYVDAIHMRTFEYAGPWDNKVGFTAALYDSRKNAKSIDAALQIYRDAGVPVYKLLLGIAFYARTFTTDGDGSIGEASQRSLFKGPILGNPDLLGYNEICRMKRQHAWHFKFDRNASQTIGKFISDARVRVAVFDSPRSVANKVKYAIEQNMGGVWAWWVDVDDFNGECDVDATTYDDFQGPRPLITQNRDFPLLRTMNDVMRFYGCL